MKNVLRKQEFIDPPEPVTSTLADRLGVEEHTMPVFAAAEVIARVTSKYRLELNSTSTVVSLPR